MMNFTLLIHFYFFVDFLALFFSAWFFFVWFFGLRLLIRLVGKRLILVGVPNIDIACYLIFLPPCFLFFEFCPVFFCLRSIFFSGLTISWFRRLISKGFLRRFKTIFFMQLFLCWKRLFINWRRFRRFFFCCILLLLCWFRARLG